MAKIKGVCHNYDGCDKAADKIVQEAEKSNFVCEECGKPLYPIKKGPKPAGDGKRIATLIAIFGGAALVIGGIVYGIVFGVQKSRENAEAERIEIARQDSIRAAEAAEQARLDSIKALEEKPAGSDNNEGHRGGNRRPRRRNNDYKANMPEEENGFTLGDLIGDELKNARK